MVEQVKTRRRRRHWLREIVIEDLQRNGPVSDQRGRTMLILAERIGHTSSMSVGNIIRALEAEGNATRVIAKDGQAPRDADGNPSPHNRRTYFIGLTDEFAATLPPLEPLEAEEAVETSSAAKTDLEPDPPDDTPPVEATVQTAAEAENTAPATDGDFQAPDGLDYDLLGRAVLSIVFNNLTASDEVEQARQDRQQLADTRTALAEAKQVITALGAQLDEERKQRAKVEDIAAGLSVQVEELRTELKTATDTAIDTARTRNWDLRDVASEKSIRALEQIMKSVPTAKG